MGELVDQGFQCLRGGDVGADGDLLSEEVAVTIRTPLPLANDLIARVIRLDDQRVPDAFGCFSVEELRADSVENRQRLAFCLGDVEDVRRAESAEVESVFGRLAPLPDLDGKSRIGRT